MTRLLIVIVNYRTAGLVVDCLHSLVTELSRVPGMRVIVIDNASGDNSVDIISEAIETMSVGKWVTLLPLEHNGGFAYGNNKGIRYAQEHGGMPEYVLLLNPDTYIRPRAVEALVKEMDRHPEVGIAGSRLEDPDGTPQRSAFRFHSLRSELNDALCFGPVSRLLRRHIVAPEVPTERVETDWVAGASMIIRREVFDAIGLMDETFFMYYEEVDYCRRAANAGYLCAYVPESRVVHLVGQASGVTDVKQRKRRPAYWFAARRRYFDKHHGGAKRLLIDIVWTLGRCLFRLRNRLTGRPDPDPPYLIRDFIRYSIFAFGSN